MSEFVSSPPHASTATTAEEVVRHGKTHQNRGDRLFMLVLKLSAFLPLVLMLLFVAVLLQGAWPSIERFGISFLFTNDWDPSEDREIYGALPSIYGTLFSSIGALAIAGPIGIGVAAFLSEVVPSRLRSVVVFLIEILATVPSIVYGIWAFFVLVPFIADPDIGIQTLLTERLPATLRMLVETRLMLAITTAALTLLPGWWLASRILRRRDTGPVASRSFAIGFGVALLLGGLAAAALPAGWHAGLVESTQLLGADFFLFRGPPLGLGLLAATLVLAVMILPLIVSISLDAIRAVPASYREAALGLGATRWEVIRVAILPPARSGLIGACILALGRALGETMAVTMVVGNSNLIRWSLFEPAATISSVIANNFSEAFDLMRAALIELALILFVMTMLVNLLARFLVAQFGAQKVLK